MSLSIIQTYTALSPGLESSFLGLGGVSPLVYSVRSGGAGGTINSSTGVYTAPSRVNPNPDQSSDVIQVRDNVGAIATASILVTSPIGLFAEIIQNQMNLPVGRVIFWDQKIFIPTDNDLFVAISVPTCKPYASESVLDGSSGLVNQQSLNMQAIVEVDIISRGPAARDEKEFVVLALGSTYSEQQQEANSFYISKLSNSFVNLSNIDGSAIPYRYKISFSMLYCVTNNVSVDYFNTFQAIQLVTNA